jgi:tight adherence protein B
VKLYVGPFVLPLGPIKWLGVALVLAGIFVFVWLTARRPDSWPYRLWAKYVNHLEAEFQLMFLTTRGQTVAVGQVAAVALIGAASTLTDIPGAPLAMIAACIGPHFWIKRMKAQRLKVIDGQVNAFIISLSNALKSTPSLGDALRISGELIAPPLQDEINYAVKTLRVGASVEQALALTASRIGSADIDVVFSALLIGRNVGGDLPTILDSTAASIREMMRLHQVLGARTAEGRAQIWVLAAFPMVLIMALAWLMPGYFDPFTSSFTGYVVAGIAGVCWASSIILARGIMKFDM